MGRSKSQLHLLPVKAEYTGAELKDGELCDLVIIHSHLTMFECINLIFYILYSNSRRNFFIPSCKPTISEQKASKQEKKLKSHQATGY